MKKIGLFCAAALAFSVQTQAATMPFTAGVFLGTPTSGVTVQYWDRLQFAVGLDTFSVSADAKWYFNEFTGRTDLAPFYVYTGLQWVDDNQQEWGPRTGVGASLYFPRFQLYAEGGPTWYLQDESSVEFEGSLGVRFHL
ncbi:hypothetical protein [Photobacterium nomapromontoriensis]|uniref:hypothetical protein n=1 Tax=Photobacterium nomapromontoriensis TaxID=2910237 RepID=UPI003D0A12A6